MYQVKLVKLANDEDRDFLVQERGISKPKKKINWLDYARVSVIKKENCYLIVTDYPGKNYVRMGPMSEDIREARIEVRDKLKEAEREAYGEALAIGQKLARKREGKLWDCI